MLFRITQLLLCCTLMGQSACIYNRTYWQLFSKFVAEFQSNSLTNSSEVMGKSWQKAHFFNYYPSDNLSVSIDCPLEQKQRYLITFNSIFRRVAPRNTTGDPKFRIKNQEATNIFKDYQMLIFS
jgi:hypothetical protein